MVLPSYLRTLVHALRVFAVTACAASLVIASPAGAQIEPALIAPLEVLSCDFRDGKTRVDLDGLATAFNRWMEESGAPQYSAFALFPLAHSSEVDFDVAWVGAWPDGTTMGESMAHYFERGAELRPLFDEVLDCRDNTNFSALTLRAPVDVRGLGPVEAASCTLRLGSAVNEALAAANEWAEFTATLGSTAAHWLLFPAYGERSDASYTFKWVVGYESFEAFGRDYDQFTNGDALDKYNELIEFVMRCDSPRLYSVRTVRAE